MIVGKIIGDTTTSECQFKTDKKIRSGEYVVVKNIDDEDVLGVIKNIKASDNHFICGVKILGVLKGKKLFPNRSPIVYGGDVYLGDEEILKTLFYNEKGIKIGHLLTRESISVYLDVDKLVSRHFAILAVTGGGKSNTVAVICKELGSKNGTLVIFDPHGEYMKLSHESIEMKMNPLTAKIDPSLLSPNELADLVGIDKEDKKERIYLSFAFNTVKRKAFENRKELRGSRFLEELLNIMYEWVKNVDVGWDIEYYNPRKKMYDRRKLSREDGDVLFSLIDIIENFQLTFSENIGDRDILEKLEVGKINVVDLSGLEVSQMVSIVSYVARRLLSKRILYLKAQRNFDNPIEDIRKKSREILNEIKTKYRIVTKPLLLIVEEAHIYIPINEYNDASLWLGKIAREGRKFGVGLGLISQRPKQLNPDVLSQTNTKIILRIVEPEDQKYIQMASEDLGEDLVKDLASLGIGEAVIIGTAISMPTIVKIDKFDGSYGGEDIKIYDAWNSIGGDEFVDDFKFGF
ncbi:ATP-binding protein [Methanotorris formicicus]|uniref:HerA-ATP synthase, barrel domain n=1 Tax=Methanotorris formicicus Mc-S-70 TaxID=647171 RepID=H1KZY6_9EURY|nr:ATP-binding protein [Methanotorris formicicus]EHP85396.1 HerA-ATP synthase, barrel domain [Methanotorris formicicus Mc-S-70]